MKKIRIKSAVPIYLAALVWVLVGLIAPGMLLKIGTILVTAVISVAAYLIGSKVFPGKEVEVRERVNTGDEEANRQIEQARVQLEQLRKHNDALPDAVISERLDRMTRSGEAILSYLEKNPSRRNEVRRFLNYFLPTAEKLMSSYVAFANSPAQGENVRTAMEKVENSLATVADAFEKQLDSLYREQSFDIEAEVSVMETLLRSEGLVDDNSIRKQSNTAQTGI